jgi:hypothetical protein
MCNTHLADLMNLIGVLWCLGHQATFPHIQWSAAFVGVEGAEVGGETFAGIPLQSWHLRYIVTG